MTADEKDLLRTAILTICDPRGNWGYGWELLCRLAEIEPQRFSPPFRHRSEEEMMRSAKDDPRPRLPLDGPQRPLE